MNNPIIVDNFYEDPDSIRNYALSLKYNQPKDFTEDNVGWLGYRCFTRSDSFALDLSKRLKKANCNFTAMMYYFHYCLEETKNFNAYNMDFHEYKIHTDPIAKFAGVIYLHPDPPKNTGTSFYTDKKEYVSSIENKYNRFICYPSNIYHGPTDLFGDTKENGRLTLTFFCK